MLWLCCEVRLLVWARVARRSLGHWKTKLALPTDTCSLWALFGGGNNLMRRPSAAQPTAGNSQRWLCLCRCVCLRCEAALWRDSPSLGFVCLAMTYRCPIWPLHATLRDTCTATAQVAIKRRDPNCRCGRGRKPPTAPAYVRMGRRKVRRPTQVGQPASQPATRPTRTKAPASGRARGGGPAGAGPVARTTINQRLDRLACALLRSLRCVLLRLVIDAPAAQCAALKRPTTLKVRRRDCIHETVSAPNRPLFGSLDFGPK